MGKLDLIIAFSSVLSAAGAALVTYNVTSKTRQERDELRVAAARRKAEN